jgi:hypothetical protein
VSAATVSAAGAAAGSATVESEVASVVAPPQLVNTIAHTKRAAKNKDTFFMIINFNVKLLRYSDTKVTIWHKKQSHC